MKRSSATSRRTFGGVCCLLLPFTLSAGDAVVVNLDGTTSFGNTVSGPNLLFPAQTSAAISGTVTLDATAAGKLYTVSGTANNYSINLPSATIANGAVIGFSVAPWASANQQYTLAPSSGQTIDGRSSLVLIYTNYVELISVGGTWITKAKKVDTDWTPIQPITFAWSVSTPANPKGTTTTDMVRWRRSGQNLIASYKYRQTTAASANGSGVFQVVLPNGFQADVSASSNTRVDLPQAFNPESVGSAGVGSVYIGYPSTVIIGMPFMYSASNVAFSASIMYTQNTSNYASVLTNSYWGALNGAFCMSADIVVPIANW